MTTQSSTWVSLALTLAVACTAEAPGVDLPVPLPAPDEPDESEPDDPTPGGPRGDEEPLQILPLGDSITVGGPFTYRYALHNLLSEAELSFGFVGSDDWVDLDLYPADGWDRDHEGHGGWTTGDIDDELETFLAGYTPDVVLVHLGTNDASDVVNNGASLRTSEAAMTSIVEKLRADNPSVAIYLAQIIPFETSNVELNETVDDWNQRLAQLSSGLDTSSSPISLVDMNTGFGDADLNDGVHPNEQGAARMAQAWAEALLP
ncbi:MAG: SGNH/GDSL hydrolase family protein [Myxococcota bacterium]